MKLSSLTRKPLAAVVAPLPKTPHADLTPLRVPLERASLCTERGCYEQALEAWKQVICLQPDSAFAHLTLGGIFTEFRCWADALRSFQQAAHLQPLLKEAHYGAGMAYGRLGYFPQAKAAFQQALEIPPEVANSVYFAEYQRLYDLIPATSPMPVSEAEWTDPADISMESDAPMHAVIASDTAYHVTQEAPLPAALFPEEARPLPEEAPVESEHDAQRRLRAEEAIPSRRSGPSGARLWEMAGKAFGTLLAPLQRPTRGRKAPLVPPDEFSHRMETELSDATQEEQRTVPMAGTIPPHEFAREIHPARSLRATLAYLKQARKHRVETVEIAVLCNQTGDALAEHGRYNEAEALYRQALTIQRRILPEGHPQLALSLNNLALLYDSQHLYEKAEPHYQRALEIAVRALGTEAPMTQTILNNFSSFLVECGRRDEAAALLEQYELRR